MLPLLDRLQAMNQSNGPGKNAAPRSNTIKQIEAQSTKTSKGLNSMSSYHQFAQIEGRRKDKPFWHLYAVKA